MTTASIRYLIMRCYLPLCFGLALAQSGAAQPLFIDVSEGSGVTPRSGFFNMNIADYNNDGWPDLFSADAFGHRSGQMLLLHNNGDGTFADQTEALQADMSPQYIGGGAGFADYDNDGDLDLFVSVGGGFAPGREPGRNVLLRNDRGIFTDVTVQAGLMDELVTGNAIWLDYDRDGYVDLFTGNAGDHELHRNKLYRNNGDGSFADVTEEVKLGMRLGHEGGSHSGMVAGDFNDDSWPDLYLGVWGAPNRLFLSDGQGKFLDATTDDIGDPGWAFGVAAGDFDGDGDLDIFQASTGGEILYRSTMLLNIGDGAFLDVTDAVGLGELIEESIRFVSMADLDNDGDLDLITESPRYLFLNDGDGTFSDVSSQQPEGILGTIGDLNLDGFLDLWGWGIYQNLGNENHYLRVVLEGTESNRSGIGTRLIVTVGGRQLMRETRSGNGFHQQDLVAHFGLGSETRVDQLEIRWPSGQVDVLTGISVDQTIRIIEGQEMYHEVQPTLWESVPPGVVEVGSTARFQAAVRPGLFERDARITSVVADLSNIGGPDAVSLTDGGDGTYALDVSVEVEGSAGVKSLFVLVEQATSLGTQWSRLVRPVTVVSREEVVFADGLGDNWKVASLEGAEVDLAADGAVFEGVAAMGLAVEPFVAEFRMQEERESMEHVALRFAFHPGTARLTESAAEEPMARLIFGSWRDHIPNDIYVMDADGGHMSPLIAEPEKGEFDPSWSPDGKKIAFHKALSNSNSEIYVVDADGSNPVNLTNSTRLNRWPSWSPDGTKIAFHSDRDGNYEVYVIDADGSNPVNLTNHSDFDGFPSWSPGGRKIVFGSNRGPLAMIFVMDADGTHQFNVSRYLGEHSPMWEDIAKWLPGVAPLPVLARFGVAVNGHLVSLLEKEEREFGVDLERNEWQVVEIPLENFMVKGPIHTITITGNLEGMFYLDDIRFVSEMSSLPDQTVVLEERQNVLPDDFSLDQNYPNPFNSDTVIRFALPEGDDVELVVYNLAGQKVAMLVQGAREAGTYSVRWDGRDDGGRTLASGVYLYRLRTANGQQVETRKLLLLK